MAASKKTAEESQDPEATETPAASSVQHIGEKADPFGNHAHTLLSGPDSPGPADYAKRKES